MAIVNITTNELIVQENDSIVIVNNFESIRGGRTLDTTGFVDEVIHAGHIIIEETSTGTLKPLPTSGTLPGSHTYKGVLVASVLTAKPFASIMTRGSVNKLATKYAVPAGAISALSLIQFVTD